MAVATRKQPVAAPETMVEMGFPRGGVDLTRGFERQTPRQISEQEYARTTPSGVNVRGYEALTQRNRGGVRPGLIRYVPNAVIKDWIVQELALLVTDRGTAMQTSQSGRVVYLVAVAQGQVFYLTAGATVWTQATNNTGLNPPLNFNGVLYSTPANQKLWFADGINWAYFDPSQGAVFQWKASAGTLPVDSQNNLPRLICTWRGRIVLAGQLLDPQNWFMSAVDDPTDWDFAPVNFTPTQAIFGTNAPQGLVGDNVTSLCPYNDDVLLMFCDHSIYLFRGDPLAGGQKDLITDAIGGTWGICWCKDPYGTVYFISNKTGVYSLVPGQQPQRISQQIEQLLLAMDTGSNNFRLIWDDRYQGLHILVTPLAAPAATTHFFYEQRTGAWWVDSFANHNHDPLACCVYDGNLPGDRLALIGSWDGYVRSFSPSATDDDGTAISSSVMIGPINSKTLDDFLCKDVQGILGEGSGSVTYAVYVGSTAEQALANPIAVSGTWQHGRNLTAMVRRSGHAVFVNVSSTNFWAMEGIRARIAGQGKVRQRGA